MTRKTPDELCWQIRDDNGLVTPGPGAVAVIATDKQDSSIEAVSWIRIRPFPKTPDRRLSLGWFAPRARACLWNALLSSSFLGRSG